jgi:hypothetical protein
LASICHDGAQSEYIQRNLLRKAIGTFAITTSIILTPQDWS